MFFRHSCEIVGLGENLKQTTGLDFNFKSPIEASLHVGNKHPDGRQLSGASNAACFATTAGDISDSSSAEVIRSALSSSVDGKWANFGGTAANLSSAIWPAVDHFFGPLRQLVESAVPILRWRCGLAQGPATDLFCNHHQYLSEDGEVWFEVSMLRGLQIVFFPPIRQVKASSEIENDVVEFVNNGNEEPLGHQLLREAWSQRGSHPRSALVIGVAAAEVGLKKLIGALVPEAEWLLDEIQTPPFSKMLRKYLPSLKVKAHFQGKSIAPPNKLIAKLDRAVEHRNKMVHAGKAPPPGGELEEMLKAVEELLWICDAYSGHRWVAGYISSDTIADWGSE